MLVYFKNMTTKQHHPEMKKEISKLIKEIRNVRNGGRASINISDETPWHQGGSSETDLVETLRWIWTLRFS